MTDLLDDLAAAAVDLAREAAESEGRGLVGSYVGAVADGERLVSHLFECTSPAYPGWRWSVTVARAPQVDDVTIDEIVLLPGPDALVAPAWVPWADRVQPGDLSVGDVLPHRSVDPLLAPGYSGADDLEGLASLAPLHPGQWELGLGRERVLSADGLLDAAERWAEGEQGPRSAMALSAPGLCSSCGYLMSIGGALGQAFGVCAAPLSPADGRVVALDYGCGAHSEATKTEPEPEPLRTDLELVDLVAFEPPVEPVVEDVVVSAAADLTADDAALAVAVADDDAESATEVDAAPAWFESAVAEALSVVEEVVGEAKAAFGALLDKVESAAASDAATVAPDEDARADHADDDAEQAYPHDEVLAAGAPEVGEGEDDRHDAE